VQIDGEVDGEVTAKDTLSIGETGVVAAPIKAASVVVAGRVRGNITAAERIEIRPSAQVAGNLTAPVLAIHEGARFEGRCSQSAAI